jgi:GDP-L-fucose synthase
MSKPKILITGGTGTVGKHLSNLGLDAVYVSSAMCNFTDTRDSDDFFKSNKPDIVVHLAAKVGGILANINNPVDYLESNLLINTNVIRYAHKYGCRRFIGTLSTCIYPDKLQESDYPLSEEKLYEGQPPDSNFSYAMAKRCLDIQLLSYVKQYNIACASLIPCNLYSELDNSTSDKAHFLTSLIRKIINSKLNNTKSITLFGTGSPMRQFMHAEDFAHAIISYISKGQYRDNMYYKFNVATPEIYTIKQFAEIALDVCDAKNITINWDTSKPDGQFRKDVSDTKFKELFPNFNYISVSEGIKRVYNNYLNELVIK